MNEEGNGFFGNCTDWANLNSRGTERISHGQTDFIGG